MTAKAGVSAFLWLLCGLVAPAAAVPVDRAVARFHAPDTGGPASPHFVFERVLAFEARLEALGDAQRGADPAPYRDRHVTSALERHVAETLIAGLRIDPEPSDAELAHQIENVRTSLVERVGGEPALERAARAEGMGVRDVLEILQRGARASLYLDRMVAPMLDPSDAELEALHRARRTPFRDMPFAQIRPGLRRWYVAQRLSAAVQSFYQNARGRLTFTPLGDLPGTAGRSKPN
jgi:hypothetical protein